MNCLKTLLAALILTVVGGISPASAQDYYLYVAAESEDKVYLVKYDADSGEAGIADSTPVGQWPTEMEGPHGLNIGLEGKYWYLSIAHGNPYGWLYKYKTGSNEFVSKTELGMFPASLEISKLTGLLYVVNFNLHGDPEPSTVSVVDPETMEVVTDIPTGIMPHGSRITDDGRYQYHVSMMTDELVQIDAAALKVSKRFKLAEGGEKGKPVCKPTWADPHPTEKRVYVACNGSDTILEIDTEAWTVSRTFTTGKAPYNLEVSPNGKYLVASYKGEGATGIWNLETGREAAKVQNSRRVSHGVTISPDSKVAFISVEGVGGEPGSVDVIDLESRSTAAVVEVGKQAGGIIFWKMGK